MNNLPESGAWRDHNMQISQHSPIFRLPLQRVFVNDEGWNDLDKAWEGAILILIYLISGECHGHF
jgi:hypothetical protein